MSVVYLIHFSRPYHHARHYVGYTSDLPARIWAHYRGRGSRLMAAIHLAGIGFRVARVWDDGTRTLERRIKRQRRHKKFCPICSRRPRQLREEVKS